MSERKAMKIINDYIAKTYKNPKFHLMMFLLKIKAIPKEKANKILSELRKER